MAKRIERKAILTPQSRGASTSTQKRQKTELRGDGKKPLPWAVRPPKAARQTDEEALYSQPSQAAIGGGRARRTEEAMKAAARRQQTDIENLQEDDDDADDADDTEDDGSGDGNGDGDDDDSGATASPENEAFTLSDLTRLIEEFQRKGAAPTAVAPSQAPATAIDIEAEVNRRLFEELQKVAEKTNQPNATARPQQSTSLVLLKITDVDVDRLWDWLRSDPESSYAFFSRLPETTVDLRRIVAALVEGERNGISMIRALHYEILTEGQPPQRQHLGFAMVAPMFTDDRMALLHLYLEQQWRGRLHSLLPSLLELASIELPNFRLSIVPNGPAQLRLYSQLLPPLGFAAHTMFVR